MSELPVVSIITPTYNRAAYIDETIQSVLSQDYPHIEYIVLDDGSTDNTQELLKRHTDRIIWESHPNMGEQRTVNKALHMVKGDFVAILNSDDTFLPGAIGTFVNFMQTHPEILVVYSNWIQTGPHGEVLSSSEWPDYDYPTMLRHFLCPLGPGALIRRKAFDLAGIRDPEFKYVADFDFWLRLGLHGPFARLPQHLVTFRLHPQAASVVHKGEKMAEENVRLIEKFYAQPNLPPEVMAVRAEAFRAVYLKSSQSCEHIRELAVKYYLKAAVARPSGVWKDRGRKHAITHELPKLASALVLSGWYAVKRAITRG
jgi:glycosyltransferase involved in cell wall biosynthesis